MPVAKMSGGTTSPAKLGLLDNSVIGVCAGIAEVTIMQPTVSWKNALQQGRPLPWSPLELYRGLGANAMAMGAVTAIQFGIFGALNGVLDPVVSGAAAGGAGALIASPLEMVMIRQQTDKAGLRHTLRIVLSHPMRGYSMMACRDGSFTAGYKGLAPTFTRWISGKEEYKNATSAERVVGSVAAGLVVGIVSHPFDTIKTVVQGSSKAESPIAVCRNLISAGGIQALYRGVGPRGIRIIGGIVILREGERLLEPLFVKTLQS